MIRCGIVGLWFKLLLNYIFRFRDRVPVKADSQHDVCEMDDGKCEVKIKSAQKSDAGVYSCKISNEYGSEQTKCRLEVKG